MRRTEDEQTRDPFAVTGTGIHTVRDGGAPWEPLIGRNHSSAGAQGGMCGVQNSKCLSGARRAVNTLVRRRILPFESSSTMFQVQVVL